MQANKIILLKMIKEKKKSIYKYYSKIKVFLDKQTEIASDMHFKNC